MLHRKCSATYKGFSKKHAADKLSLEMPKGSPSTHDIDSCKDVDKNTSTFSLGFRFIVKF